MKPGGESAHPIRVVLADDSAVIRQLLRAALLGDGGFEVVAEAATGEAAVAACERWRPDVVAMDVAMPGAGGLWATGEIVRRFALPVVIVSSALSDRTCRMAVDAFRLGAIDVASKPDLRDREAGMRAISRLVETLRAMSSVKVLTRRPEPPPGAATPAEAPAATAIRCVAIGASTGGPEVLRRLVAGLPAGFPAPVLIAQHIVPGFMASLVEWLQSHSRLPVLTAVQGDLPRPGHVYLARDGHHLALDRVGGRFILEADRLGLAHQPSVDHLFLSLTGLGSGALGILLTGMGADGAAGLAALRAAGATTMAQDEDSSVVWGMPGEAVRRQAAGYVGNPDALLATLLRLCPPALARLTS